MEPATVSTWPVVGFTGHRRQILTPRAAAWVQDSLPQVASRLAQVYGTTRTVCGLALGADTWWAQAALGAGIELHSYLPCPQQAGRWAPKDRELWIQLQARSARVVFAADRYTARALHVRNDMILRDASLLVAVWDRQITEGGTASVVRKARAKGLPILLLDPGQLAVERIGW